MSQRQPCSMWDSPYLQAAEPMPPTAQVIVWCPKRKRYVRRVFEDHRPKVAYKLTRRAEARGQAGNRQAAGR